jgi:hypothetical protein
MTRYNSIALFILPFFSMVWTASDGVTGFTLRPAAVHSSTFVAVGTILSSKNGDDELQQEEQKEATADDENDDKAEFNWLEKWALEGKDAIALMKTAERTQRVMVAQMTEDRIYDITKVLDTLVDEATGQIAEADMPKAKELAMQTRNLQKEYKDLVTGAPSTLLDTLANLKLDDDNNDKK